MPRKLMYPRNNAKEVALFYDEITKEFIFCRDMQESGQYAVTGRYQNPLEAWTRYIDTLDLICRKKIMEVYGNEIMDANKERVEQLTFDPSAYDDLLSPPILHGEVGLL